MIAREGLTLLGWRDVPTDNSTLGESVKPTEPVHMQVFIGRGNEDQVPRTSSSAGSTSCASRSRNAIYQRRERRDSPAITRCRCRAAPSIYKGMFLADQLGTYYPDLHDPDFESALALVHQRFSTNTFPTWSLAHPYRDDRA